MPIFLPSWLHHKLLDTIRRLQPCEMDELLAESEIAERVEIRDVRSHLAQLEDWRLVRNVTPAGQEALERHAASVRSRHAVSGSPQAPPPEPA